MQKSAKSRAAEIFTATQKKTKQILTEIEKEHQVRAENMAKQRALRLAKEAGDRESADQPASKKAAAKIK